MERTSLTMWLSILICLTLASLFAQDATGAPACDRAIAALTRLPEVTPLEIRAGRSAHFAYKPGGAIDLLCAANGAAEDMTIGASPLPTAEFWPFFRRLARIMDVDPNKAVQAAQVCRDQAEARLRRAKDGKLVEGDPIQTDALHVDCRIGENFLSFGVFRPPE